MHHTPSPWIPARDATGELALWDEQDRHLFFSDGESPLPIRERVANIRLAAMAPRLLDALHALLEQTVDQDLNHGIGLTEGEEDARQQAIAIFAELDTPTALDTEADLIAGNGDEEAEAEDEVHGLECTLCTDESCAWCQAERAAKNS